MSGLMNIAFVGFVNVLFKSKYRGTNIFELEKIKMIKKLKKQIIKPFSYCLIFLFGTDFVFYLYEYFYYCWFHLRDSALGCEKTCSHSPAHQCK